MMETAYKVLSRERINIKRWDSCVQSASGQSLYGTSWYLDAACPGWKGIVKEDYEAVFPLCNKRKFIFKYLYQPLGLQSVKWYSPTPISQLDYFYLFSILFTDFHFIDINIDMECDGKRKYLEKFEIKATQFLDIGQDDFRSYYSKRMRYGIRKAQKAPIKLVKYQDIQLFENLVAKSTTFKRIENCKRIRKNIKAIVNAAKSRGQMWFGYIGEKPVTAAFLIENNNTLYFSFLFTLEEGFKNCVNHYLIDEIIESNRNEFQTLDFSGSNLEGIAFFNKGFGAKNKYYIHINTRKSLLRKWINSFV